jgi:hypothetical protein
VSKTSDNEDNMEDENAGDDIEETKDEPRESKGHAKAKFEDDDTFGSED